MARRKNRNVKSQRLVEAGGRTSVTDVTPWVNYDKDSVFPRAVKTQPVFKSWSALFGRLFFFRWNNATICVDPRRFNVVATKTKRKGGGELTAQMKATQYILMSRWEDECRIHMPAAFTVRTS